MNDPHRVIGGRRVRRADAPDSGDRPLVSVILPVRDAAECLPHAIDGILRQSLRRLELLVIDGGGDDATRAALGDLDESVDYWESAPDRGIYDGMNRGIDAARGEWLYFMGVDDSFVDREVLADLLERGGPADTADLVLGRVITADGRLFVSRFGASLLLKNTVHHQAALYRRRVFDSFRFGCRKGRHRRCLQILGDYQLNLKLFRQGRRAHGIDRVMARCGSGVSRQGRWVGYLEEILVRHGEIPFWAAFPFDLQTLVRYMLKQVTTAKSKSKSVSKP